MATTKHPKRDTAAEERQGRLLQNLSLPSTIMAMHKLQVKTNSVKEGVPIKGEFTLGKEDYGPEVVPDCYPAAVRNKTNTRFVYWNVRTMYEFGKFENIKQEMERLKLDILVVCEVGWKGKGDFAVTNIE